MENQSITALFNDAAAAESAIGRLEVAGVLPENITVQLSDNADRTAVTAELDPALIEKVTGILSADGTITTGLDSVRSASGLGFDPPQYPRPEDDDVE